VPLISFFPRILYNLDINDAPALPGSHLSLFADDTSIYAAQNHKRCVLYKLQRCLTAVKSYFERRNIKINEGQIQRSVSPEDLRVPEDVLQFIGRDIPFVNTVTL
jgi:hypothetical protein